MKRVLFALLALILGAAICAVGQENAPSKTKTQQKASAREVTIVGTIAEDGKTFTSDKNQKTYTLVNPEAVQGHAGHHVALRGHVTGDQIHVMSLKMEAAGKKKGAPAKP